LSFAIAIVVVGRRGCCVVAVVEDKIQKTFQFNGMECGMEWNHGIESWNGMESWNHGIME
jgi:hypothetical protein